MKILKGMMFDNGFISPYMADDPARLEGELTEPYILLTTSVWATTSQTSCPCWKRSCSPVIRC